LNDAHLFKSAPDNQEAESAEKYRALNIMPNYWMHGISTLEKRNNEWCSFCKNPAGNLRSDISMPDE